MPKFLIGSVSKNKIEDEPVTLWLEESVTGGITLRGRLGDGTSWYILTVKDTGEIALHSSIHEELGLLLDKAGYVKVRKE
jgi:hypothetical protein